jgi:hypothetical protein
MGVDDVRRARREVSGLIAQKQQDNHNKLIESVENGKISSIEDIEELYKQDKISLQVLQGFRKNYTSSQKKVNIAKKNDLEFTIYKASQIVDPVQRKEYFNNLKEKVLSSGLDIPGKLALCKDIDQLRNAENKPGGDRVADSLLYGVQQFNEKLVDNDLMKVYDVDGGWFWRDIEKPDKTDALRNSELQAMKRWLKSDTRTVPEIDEYVSSLKKKYAKQVTLKGFTRHFSGVNQKTISKAMKPSPLIRRTTADGKTALFDAETKKFVRYE